MSQSGPVLRQSGPQLLQVPQLPGPLWLWPQKPRERPLARVRWQGCRQARPMPPLQSTTTTGGQTGFASQNGRSRSLRLRDSGISVTGVYRQLSCTTPEKQTAVLRSFCGERTQPTPRNCPVGGTLRGRITSPGVLAAGRVVQRRACPDCPDYIGRTSGRTGNSAGLAGLVKKSPETRNRRRLNETG